MPLDSLLNHGGLASPRRSHSWSCVQCRDQRGDSGTGATLIIQFRRVRTSTTTIQGGQLMNYVMILNSVHKALLAM